MRRRLTPRQKASIVEEQGGMCWQCHEPLNFGTSESPGTDFDHIKPLWMGGADEVENICALHRTPCHREKTRSEAPLRAKADRQRRFQEEGRGRKRKGPKIPSRPFDRRWRKKLRTGEVEPR